MKRYQIQNVHCLVLSEPKNETKKIGEWPFASVIESYEKKLKQTNKHVNRLYFIIWFCVYNRSIENSIKRVDMCVNHGSFWVNKGEKKNNNLNTLNSMFTSCSFSISVFFSFWSLVLIILLTSCSNKCFSILKIDYFERHSLLLMFTDNFCLI